MNNTERINNIAANWYQNERAEIQALSASSATTTGIGTAVSDSSNGRVKVILSNNTITYNDSGIAVEIPTAVQVKNGDSVIVLYGGNTKEPRVIGVIGRGDETAKDILEALSKADESALQAALAEASANIAAGMAEEAQKTAKAVGQHFFYDENGVHVTTDEDNPDGESNLLANSEGIQLRHEDKILSSVTPSGFTVFDGEGNNDENILASFGESTIIGRVTDDEVHMLIDNDSFDIVNGNLHIGRQSTNDASSFIFGTGVVDDGALFGTIFGTSCYVEKPYGFAHGDGAQAIGKYSLASGDRAQAQGDYSHSLGTESKAIGAGSFAAGIGTEADGDTSAAFGRDTKTNGNASAAFGYDSEANGDYCFASGQGLRIGNKSVGLAGAAFGQYNDDESALFVVGDGWDDNNRKDAFVVHSGGNAEVSGILKDTPISGEGTQTGLSSSGSFCRWCRSGNVVEVIYYVAPVANISTYSKGAFLFQNLPGAINDDVGFVAKIDGTAGTALVHVDTYGRFAVEARETAISANTHVLGHFTYITNERYTYTV